MDKLGAMKTFVRIVEAGSLTARGGSLDTSLPTVVRTLAALERNLGVSLLKRTTRRIHLTDEGTHYLEHCRDILAATQEAEDILGRAPHRAGGQAFGHRIGPVRAALSRPDRVRLPAALSQGQRRYAVRRSGCEPDRGRHRCRHSDRPSAGFIPGGDPGRPRTARCLRQRAIPAPPRRPASPKRCPSRISASDIVGLVPRNEWHFRVGNRQLAVPINNVVTCNEIDSAVNACIDGLGLGMFLSYMVAPLPEEPASSNMFWKNSRPSRCRSNSSIRRPG